MSPFFQNTIKVLLSSLFIACLSFSDALAFNYIPFRVQDSLEYEIDKIMLTYSGKDRPGAVIGLIQNGQLVFKKGYGMAELKSKKPNQPEVAYKIASLSKQFTATAIVSLILKQKIKSSDDIRKFLPLFPQYNTVITINDLLYHTSGIRDYMVLMWLTGNSFENKFSNDDALKMIYRQNKLNFRTGSRCVYSNSNYVLLAEILKKVSGKNLGEYTDTEIFKPLHMTNTGFDGYKVSEKTQRALSYYHNDSGYHPFKNNNSVIGDGGILTTIDDLLKWDNFFYDTASLAAEILVKGRLDNGNPLTYAMGIMTGTYKGQSIQFHPGAFLGYRAEMLRFPDKKISIICLGNTEEINPEQLTRAIADVYIFKEAQKDQLLSLPNEEINAIIGKYEVVPNVFVDIKLENGNLSGQVTGQPRQTLNPEGNYNFKIGDSDDKAIFSLPLNGRMQQLTVIQKQSKTIAKRPAIVTDDPLNKYIGSYYSEEQKASYIFYLKKGDLYFWAGNSANEVRVEILKNYNRIYFGYQNLEQATIDFQLGADGVISGFILNSGRVSDLKFIKK